MTKSQPRPLENSSSDLLRVALNDFLEDRRASGCAPATLTDYSFKLSLLLKWLSKTGITDPHNITPAHIRTYLIHLRETHPGKDSTIHDYSVVVRIFLRWLFRVDWIDTDPVAKIRFPGKGDRILPAFTEQEIARVVAACKTARDRAIVYLLLDSGLRAREVCELRVDDVCLTNGQVIVRNGKRGKARCAFIGPKVLRHLAKYLRERHNPGEEESLFVSRGNSGLTYNALRCLLRRIAVRAGVSICHAHTFRRSFAIQSLRNGMNPFSVQVFLGHTDPRTTRKYLDIVTADLEREHREHGPIR